MEGEAGCTDAPNKDVVPNGGPQATLKAPCYEANIFAGNESNKVAA